MTLDGVSTCLPVPFLSFRGSGQISASAQALEPHQRCRQAIGRHVRPGPSTDMPPSTRCRRPESSLQKPTRRVRRSFRVFRWRDGARQRPPCPRPATMKASLCLRGHSAAPFSDGEPLRGLARAVHPSPRWGVSSISAGTIASAGTAPICDSRSRRRGDAEARTRRAFNAALHGCRIDGSRPAGAGTGPFRAGPRRYLKRNVMRPLNRS